MFQARENLMKSIQIFLKKFDYISSREKPIPLLLAHERFIEIKQAFREEQHQPENIQELLRKLLNDLQVLNGILLERGEHAAQISTPYWKCLVFYDDDDEYSIQYRKYLENLSIVITTSPPILPIEDPEVSLIMGNEELNTIPEKESDEFKKSSVDDLVPIPSESEVTSGSDSECILPSDDESLSDEDVSEDNVKIYSNPLFEFDDEYISSDVNPLFDEVLESIESKDSYDSNLDEPDLLVTPLSDVLESFESKDSYDSNLDEPDLLVTPLYDVNEDECFDPGGDTDEIDVFLDIDTSMDINDGYYESEGDVIYLESLLTNDTIHSLPSEVSLDHDTKILKDESVIDVSKNMVKISTLGFRRKFFLQHM
nr:hypothetical protein [Tanacetum cinerariifolium]